jgi:hypothetical protein
MDKSIKNIAVLLVLATCALLGYYFFAQKGTTNLLLTNTDTATLFADVQKYVERRRQLDTVKMSTDLFTDPYFRSLVSYSTPVPTQPVGRDNPFDPVQSVSGSNF